MNGFCPNPECDDEPPGCVYEKCPHRAKPTTVKQTRRQQMLRRRAYDEAFALLKTITITTEDLSEEEDRAVEKIIREELASELERQRPPIVVGKRT